MGLLDQECWRWLGLLDQVGGGLYERLTRVLGLYDKNEEGDGIIR